MSYSIDANIFIYASNQDSPLYEPAKEFLSNCLNELEPIYLCWNTVFAYLRIVTHPSVFTAPLSPKEATQNIENLRAAAHVRFIVEADLFWEQYLETCKGVTVRGNLVPDAHIAALLREHGIRRIYSRNRDFRKFPFLEVINPFN